MTIILSNINKIITIKQKKRFLPMASITSVSLMSPKAHW